MLTSIQYAAIDFPSLLARAQLFIDSLPDKGYGDVFYYSIYPQYANCSGPCMQISNVPVEIPLDSTSLQFLVRYRPPLDYYSINVTESFTNISFFAVDGRTGRPSLSSASVSISVQHVNKPPVAEEDSVGVAIASRRTVLTLHGVDTDSIIRRAVIFPRNDSIHLFEHVFRGATDNSIYYSAVMERDTVNASTTTTGQLPELPAAERLALSGRPFYCCSNQTFPFEIAYTYLHATGAFADESIGFFAGDYFYFSLQDDEGRLSSPKRYTMSVDSAISVTAHNWRGLAWGATTSYPNSSLLAPVATEETPSPITVCQFSQKLILIASRWMFVLKFFFF